MRNVLLLRDPSEGIPDRYEAAFSAAGYHPVSVPVLETIHTNISNLRDIFLRSPQSRGMSGVVITSKRSCEALWEALQLLENSDNRTEVAKWNSIPFYVVGQATATALEETFSAFIHLGIGSSEIRGQSTGNAVSLAPFILNDLKARPAELLYLTGDKNRDTLLHLLEEGGIALRPLQVYETCNSSAFPKALSLAISSVPEWRPWWIIYFAPSAAAYVTPTLRENFHLEETDSILTPSIHLIPAKIAAIGPTTDTFLRNDLQLRVHAMAQKPTPEGIVSAIVMDDNAAL